MNRIFKFRLAPRPGGFKVPMPEGSRFLSIGLQDGAIVLWYVHNTAGGVPELEDRYFLIIETGQFYEAHDHEYRGTMLVYPFEWHVFELPHAAD